MAEIESPSYWAVLPAPVRYDKALSPSARILYAEISSLTHETGYCYASNDYFCRLYKLSERTIARLLRELEAGGHIRIENGRGGKGVVRKIFAGVNPLSANPDKNVRKPRQKCHGNPDKNVTQNKKEEQEREHPPISPQGDGAGDLPKKQRKRRGKLQCDYEPELFERFWKLYPRGEDKVGARYEWDELKPDLKLMKTMSAALKRLNESDDQWQRGVGVPWASRWLRERRWEWVADMAEKASQPARVSGSNTGTSEEVGEWL